jgi:cytochrome c6
MEGPVKYFLIAIFGVACLAAACAGDPPANVAVNTANTSTQPPSPLPSGTIDDIASGRKIYSVSCQGCHREDGTGGPTEIEGKKIDPDDLTSEKIKAFSDEKILGYIMNGVEDEGMPAFKGRLSEAEMRDVVKYVRSELQGMPVKASATGAAPSNASPAR